MNNIMKLVVVAGLGLFGLQAQATIILDGSLDDYGIADCHVEARDCWTGVVPKNPKVDDFETMTGITDLDLVELYKDELPGEEGIFQAVYKFDPNDDQSGGTLSLEFDDPAWTIDCPDCYLLVKDGVAHTPIWYLFDINDWDGEMDIVLQNFWNDDSNHQGSISHVSIWGGERNVPEPGVVALLAVGLLGMVVTRRKMKV